MRIGSAWAVRRTGVARDRRADPRNQIGLGAGHMAARESTNEDIDR